METFVLTTKRQLLIPKHLCAKYGFKTGVKVVFEETADGVLIKPMDENYFENLAGSLKDSFPSITEFMKIKQEEKKREERKMNLNAGTKKTGK